MGKYSGSWAKGFASTFSQAPNMVLNVLALKEKRKAQQKIEDATEELKLNSLTLAAKFDAARADGTISQEDYGDMVAWALPLGDEIMGRVNTLTNNYKNLSQEQIDNELADINAFYELSSDLDFQNIEEMEAFGNGLTQQNAKTKWGLILDSIKKRKAPPEDIWGQAGTLPQEVRPDYLRSKGIEIPQPATAQPTEMDVMGETQKKLDAAYATGNANYFNQMAKSLNVPTTFDTYKQKYEKPEQAGAGVKVDPNDVLFGTQGIMKDYINSGSQLGEEQKTKIRNNYNLIKPSLSPEVRTQVEDYLQQIGIDLNPQVAEPTPEPQPETAQPNLLQKGISGVKNWLNMKGTPKPSDYATMTEEVLFKLASEGDQLAYEEAKRRGII